MTSKSKIRYLLRNSLVPAIGWEKWNALQHHLIHGYTPNFRNPRTFLEYLQHSKYYGLARELAPLVDKYTVKAFVSERIGEFHVIPTLQIIRRDDDFDTSALPERWIAKSVHAAGWNHIHDGLPLNEVALKKKFRRWLSRNYYSVSGEVNYRYIPPKIIIEPLISDVDEDLKDYKLWCFAGKVHFIGVHGDRKTLARGQIFKLDWTASSWRYPEIPEWSTRSFDKPSDLGALIAIAEKLSAPFPFVRVDLYEKKGHIYFGELTFTPGDGNNIRIPFQEDLQYGRLIIEANAPPRVEFRCSVPCGELVHRNISGA